MKKKLIKTIVVASVATLTIASPLFAGGETPNITSGSDNSYMVATAPPAVEGKLKQPPQKVASDKTELVKNPWWGVALLYIPNRVLDALDIFDIGIGVGPTVKAQGWITRYFSFGAGIGSSAMLIKGYNRQYGAALQSGWSASFLCYTAEQSERYDTTRGIQKYFINYKGVPSLGENVYNFWHGARDLYAIGGELAVGVDIQAAIHPVAIGDFIAGIFLIDPKGDDLTWSEIK